MSEKSAIEKMVEWLKEENAKRNHTTTGIVWRHYDHIIDIATVLMEQEKAQKPTAPASWYKDMEDWKKRIG